MSAVMHQITPPTSLLDRIEQNVPGTLLGLPVWVLHTATKVPIYADGRRRQGKLDSAEDRTGLVKFKKAAAAFLVHDAAGFGIALGPVPGTDIIISGIDLDHCYQNGQLDQRAQGILNASNSYAEISLSGHGLHILGLGDIGTMKKQDGTLGVEIYSRGRYFTVTGNAVNRADLADIAENAKTARRLFGRSASAQTPQNDTGAVSAGGRNNFLTREAGKLRRIGLDSSAISAALHTLNQQRCTPPLPDEEVERTSQGILRYPSQPSEPNSAGAVQLLRGTDLTPEPISWLWLGWLARGKLHVLAGAPGCGKTTIALDFVATVTTGRKWPDQTLAMPGNVLIWSGEDGCSDTLLPRLLAMGADRSRIYFVGEVSMADGERRPFDPSRDMASLSDAARRIGSISLLIVDPIVNAVAGDSHKNTETRRSLQPLVDLAAELGTAVLGISHYTKGTQGRDPVERVTGSIAFGAIARIVLGAAKGYGKPGNPDRVLVRAKSNIGPDGGGYAYSVRQEELAEYAGVVASCIAWGAPLDGSAHELLADAENLTDGEERTALSEAEAFLRAELAGGAVASKELTTKAREAGISERTLKRAKQAMNIRAHRDGASGTWFCSLPPSFGLVSEVGQVSPSQNLGPLGPLRANQEPMREGGQEGQGSHADGVAALVNG